MEYRIERDSLGEMKIPANAMYGIHTARAVENFPSFGQRVNIYLIRAYLMVKKAALIANYKSHNIERVLFEAIDSAIDRLIKDAQSDDYGSIYDKIAVGPFQGGAGTSLNMNINEVIANTTLEHFNKAYGSYDVVHPLDHINLSQSTNDTYPTAMKMAAIVLLRKLQESFAALQKSLQEKEQEFSGILKLGRTQLQDAVPVTLGQEFGAYAQAFARDRWRFYNAEERLRSVNLGGTAVGNGITAERQYALTVVNELRAVSGLPMAKAEDTIEATQNIDTVVEVHGIIKAAAVTLQKMANDLRLLSSGPHGGFGEIKLPPLQAGSSIMPGKVNPVLPEYVIQIAETVKGNDAVIANLAGAGNLELQQFMPLIAHLFLGSMEMLNTTAQHTAVKCINGIEADRENCTRNLLQSNAIAAAFIPEYGYDRITGIAKKCEGTKRRFIDVLMEELGISKDKVNEIMKKEFGVTIEFGKEIG